MVFSLGSQKPKKEINLGTFGSIFIILVWMLLMAGLIYLGWSLFLKEEPQYYVMCGDGNTIKYNESIKEYCGMIFNSWEDIETYVSSQNNVPSIDNDWMNDNLMQVFEVEDE